MRLVASIGFSALAGALLSTVALASPSPSRSIFGMEAGKPVPYPACEAYSSKVICQRPIGSKGQPWQEIFINFPVDQVPEIMSSIVMSVKTVDGNIVGYNFETLGIRSQDRDIAILAEKFGKPSSVTYSEMANLAGGQFRAALATWEFSDFHVTLNSMGYGTRAGRVEIYTSEGMRLKRERDAADDSKRVPL